MPYHRGTRRKMMIFMMMKIIDQINKHINKRNEAILIVIVIR